MSARHLNELSPEELLHRAEELRRSIFNLRVRATTKELKNYAQISKEKRELARVLTVLREKGVKI